MTSKISPDNKQNLLLIYFNTLDEECCRFRYMQQEYYALTNGLQSSEGMPEIFSGLLIFIENDKTEQEYNTENNNNTKPPEEISNSYESNKKTKENNETDRYYSLIFGTCKSEAVTDKNLEKALKEIKYFRAYKVESKSKNIESELKTISNHLKNEEAIIYLDKNKIPTYNPMYEKNTKTNSAKR